MRLIRQRPHPAASLRSILNASILSVRWCAGSACGHKGHHVTPQLAAAAALCLGLLRASFGPPSGLLGTRTYLEMKPPDSQRCRASVPSRNRSSGWWRTSTSTESSEFTSGFRRSSRGLLAATGLEERKEDL
ncbi:hypothetical protein EYF80_054626 [Liparis tanakae]|uniref:Uncharacterized protein n=1 Tax=Liparis tanakae TaxID=230148 RepID=A0A4Z2F3F2_9TELE|nr:hypothetical protein EYF80_054626 [Liparis tanakae]